MQEFEELKSLIVKMRHFRNEYKLDNQTLLDVELEVASDKKKKWLDLDIVLKKMLKANCFNITDKVTNTCKTILFIGKKINLYIDQKVLQNLNKNQKNKLDSNFLKQKNILLAEIKRSETILNNPLFLTKASLQKIAIEKININLIFNNIKNY